MNDPAPSTLFRGDSWVFPVSGFIGAGEEREVFFLALLESSRYAMAHVLAFFFSTPLLFLCANFQTTKTKTGRPLRRVFNPEEHEQRRRELGRGGEKKTEERRQGGGREKRGRPLARGGSSPKNKPPPPTPTPPLSSSFFNGNLDLGRFPSLAFFFLLRSSHFPSLTPPSAPSVRTFKWLQKQNNKRAGGEAPLRRPGRRIGPLLSL